jgi:hypothetical protein
MALLTELESSRTSLTINMALLTELAFQECFIVDSVEKRHTKPQLWLITIIGVIVPRRPLAHPRLERRSRRSPILLLQQKRL